MQFRNFYSLFKTFPRYLGNLFRKSSKILVCQFSLETWSEIESRTFENSSRPSFRTDIYRNYSLGAPGQWELFSILNWKPFHFLIISTMSYLLYISKPTIWQWRYKTSLAEDLHMFSDDTLFLLYGVVAPNVIFTECYWVKPHLRKSKCRVLVNNARITQPRHETLRYYIPCGTKVLQVLIFAIFAVFPRSA